MTETTLPSGWMRGDWMQTFTGKAFWPLDARPEEIDPADIAHALSMLCRYGGHTRRFYSVAEHCILMSYAVSKENALAALLHDATEAYMVDLPRPIKRQIPAYSVAEDRLALVLAARFGIAMPMPAEVKDADTRILLDERAALMGVPPRSWQLDGVEPLGVHIIGWGPHEAEQVYLHRLRELGVSV